MKDAYPVPWIDQSLSKLGDANFFSTLDLGSAFWQIALRKQDRIKKGNCLRAGAVSKEKDALSSLQCHGYV